MIVMLAFTYNIIYDTSNQTPCILNILHKFGYDQSKLVSTLADPNVQVRNQGDCEYVDFDAYFPYKQVIGNICMLPWVHVLIFRM
jgi:hypothetical protein